MTGAKRLVRGVRAFVLAAALLLAAGAARAEGGDGITVQGSGEAKGKPTRVEIGAGISGEGELAADAIVKYRDARKRAVAAIEALKNPNLSIESNGFAVNSATDPNQAMMMMQGRMTTPTKPKVEVTEQMRLVLDRAHELEPESLMDTVLKIIDTGKDAGLHIGPPAPSNYYEMQMRMQSGQATSMVAFKIADPVALREAAYRKAMEDAKAKAQRLADLAGVKLGGIVSVKDAIPVKDDNPQMAMMRWMGLMGAARTDDSDLSSGVFGEITMKVNLTVQFEIVR